MDREALSRLLPDHWHFVEQPISQQKKDVESAIERFLAAVIAEKRQPDTWERFCIREALGFIRDGYYGSALANAAKALEPPEGRSPERLGASAESLGGLDAQRLLELLEEVRSLPAQARGLNRPGAVASGPGYPPRAPQEAAGWRFDG